MFVPNWNWNSGFGDESWRKMPVLAGVCWMLAVTVEPKSGPLWPARGSCGPCGPADGMKNGFLNSCWPPCCCCCCGSGPKKLIRWNDCGGLGWLAGNAWNWNGRSLPGYDGKEKSQSFSDVHFRFHPSVSLQ